MVFHSEQGRYNDSTYSCLIQQNPTIHIFWNREKETAVSETETATETVTANETDRKNNKDKNKPGIKKHGCNPRMPGAETGGLRIRDWTKLYN